MSNEKFIIDLQGLELERRYDYKVIAEGKFGEVKYFES